MELCLCHRGGGPPPWLATLPKLHVMKQAALWSHVCGIVETPLAGWLTPPPGGLTHPCLAWERDGWLGRSAFRLTKRTCFVAGDFSRVQRFERKAWKHRKERKLESMERVWWPAGFMASQHANFPSSIRPRNLRQLPVAACRFAQNTSILSPTTMCEKACYLCNCHQSQKKNPWKTGGPKLDVLQVVPHGKDVGGVGVMSAFELEVDWMELRGDLCGHNITAIFFFFFAHSLHLTAILRNCPFWGKTKLVSKSKDLSSSHVLSLAYALSKFWAKNLLRSLAYCLAGPCLALSKLLSTK